MSKHAEKYSKPIGKLVKGPNDIKNMSELNNLKSANNKEQKENEEKAKLAKILALKSKTKDISQIDSVF